MNWQREADVQRAWAASREVLAQTRGLGRGAFPRALGKAAAGSAMLSPLAGLAARIRSASYWWNKKTLI